jgi:hypothetical protein
MAAGPMMELSNKPTLAPEVLEALREFYEAWGYRTLSAGGTIWFDGGSFSVMATPTTILPDLNDKEVREVLGKMGRIVAVYGTATNEGTVVPMYTLRDKTYDFKNLQRQFKQQVNKAMQELESRECTWEEWQTLGKRCDQETLQRRGQSLNPNHPLLSDEGRKKIASIAVKIPNLRIHACFYQNEIAAYLVHLTFGSICEGLITNRREGAVEPAVKYASHLLYYTFSKEAISRPEVQMVCVGRQSVPPNETLARFKAHAGFSNEPYYLSFRMQKYLAPVFERKLTAKMLQLIRSKLGVKVPALGNLEVIERSSLRKAADSKAAD